MKVTETSKNEICSSHFPNHTIQDPPNSLDSSKGKTIVIFPATENGWFTEIKSDADLLSDLQKLQKRLQEISKLPQVSNIDYWLAEAVSFDPAAKQVRAAFFPTYTQAPSDLPKNWHFSGSRHKDLTPNSIDSTTYKPQFPVPKVPGRAKILVGQPDTGVTPHHTLPNISSSVPQDLQSNPDFDWKANPYTYSEYKKSYFWKRSLFWSHGTSTSTFLFGSANYSNTKLFPLLKPEAFSLIPYRVTESVFLTTKAQITSLTKSIQRLVKSGCRVISISLGIPWTSKDALSTEISKLRQAIKEASESGVIVCCAGGQNAPTHYVYPALFAEENKTCVSCCAVTHDFTRWLSCGKYDNYYTVAAPGDGVWKGAYNDNGDSTVEQGCGTSFATPYVAAIAASWLYNNPKYLKDNFKSKVVSTFRSILQSEEYTIPMGTDPKTVCRVIDPIKIIYHSSDYVHNLDEGPTSTSSGHSIDILELINNPSSWNLSRNIDSTVVNLSGSTIKTLPPDFFDKLTHLEKLDLSTTKQLQTLPKPNKPLTNLKKLYLSGSSIKSLPDGFFDNLINLEVLGLSETKQLQTLPKPNNEMTKLKSIYLGESNIKSLPDGFFDKLTNLEVLDLSYSKQLLIVPKPNNEMTKLKTLYLEYSNIKSLPEGFFDQLTQLEELNTSFTKQLQTLPKPNKQMTRLKTLNLNGSNIKYLPDGFFDKLINLEVLDLSSTKQLQSLPIPNNQMTRLKTLKFIGSNIKSLPDGWISSLS